MVAVSELQIWIERSLKIRGELKSCPHNDNSTFCKAGKMAQELLAFSLKMKSSGKQAMSGEEMAKMNYRTY